MAASFRFVRSGYNATLYWASACVNHRLEVNTMQTADSDFADKRNQPDVEMSGKFLESYGEGELLYPSASRMEHGTVTPAELSALLDAQDNSAAAR